MPPDSSGTDGTLAQILVKMGQMGEQLAVIGEQLKAMPDHEHRLRMLESARSKLYGGAIVAGTLSGAVATIIYWALSRK